MRLLGQFYTLHFFYEKHQQAPKNTKQHQKAQKHRNATRQNHKNANKEAKIKNALKKHLRGKKSLIRLFAFCGFFASEEKKIENKKFKKREKCS